MTVFVCMKWVALRPEIDPLDGTVTADERWSGPSPADLAALETGLRMAGMRNDRVHAITVGPAAADAMLRDALAAGAGTVTRVHADGQPSSRSVARALGGVIRSDVARFVICGDWSLDRGSGSVPPFLAAELGVGQACGLVSVLDEPGRPLSAERRLDGGRRERLLINGPAVLSVEGSVAALRRATLSGTLGAQKAVINVIRPERPLPAAPAPHRVGPFRPRARVLDGPATSASPLSRIEELTGALASRRPPQRLILDPEAAADTILAQLTEWGYGLPGT